MIKDYFEKQRIQIALECRYSVIQVRVAEHRSVGRRFAQYVKREKY